MVWGTEQVPRPSRSPWTSSESEVIVTGSVGPEVFFTETVKLTGPPGSSTEEGLGDFVTSIDGAASHEATVVLAWAWSFWVLDCSVVVDVDAVLVSVVPHSERSAAIVPVMVMEAVAPPERLPIVHITVCAEFVQV